MEQFRVFTVKNYWSSIQKFTRETEKQLKKISADGYQIISVSFSYNLWGIPVAFITAKKEIKL